MEIQKTYFPPFLVGGFKIVIDMYKQRCNAVNKSYSKINSIMFMLWNNSLDGRWNRTIMEWAQTEAQHKTVPPSNPMMGYL